ncbi:hypothetical protein DPEC_G00298450 [Dallia pectoralis]|uniref:Uncharacterized protein n=1 Tax=Dallia pectoralis TaxID=75939 RepID=A0ACC2FG34_DALPE|nr:hypothetical protein DPEC_G00298450 [Dallia pectoralis]
MALVTVRRSPTPSTTSSPCVSEAGSGEEDRHSQPRSISESFLTVKGAARFLPRGNGSSPSSAPLLSQRRNKHTGDLPQHLQTMFTVLRPEDNIRLAVRLESAHAQPECTRYMVVVSTNGRQDTEESVLLGMDFSSADSSCTVGLVLPLWSDTLIHLDGDGGFSVSTVNRVHVFKPVSVQAMWSALQSLHKACEVARCHNYYPGSLFLTWVSYYQSCVSSDQVCINQWNAMQDVQSHRSDSPILYTDVPTERERTELLIKTRLREIMMQKDLENVTSKEIRTELEMQMVCNLREFKEFIDNEMIVILGQMDSPTEIFDHVYLGSEWNASNLDELQNSGVRYILNVTREIDNFFPGMFEYHNIRVYDEEATNLLEYWNDTYKFITRAKKAGAKCLVHCKMGVSRSASTVIAYAMKEYGWDLERAFDHVKERRAVTKPNPSFMRQLEEYQGILLASKQRHNKLWRSRSDSDLSERHESPLGKTRPHSHTPGHSDLQNGDTSSLELLLSSAVLQALGGADESGGCPMGRKQISDRNSEPSQLTRSHSHSPVSGLSRGHGSSEGPRLDPFLPLLSRPQAAALVHQDTVDHSALAVTEPVCAVPHPPPSLHILPPPPPRLWAETPDLGSSPVAEPKTHRVERTVALPDLSSYVVIPQALPQFSHAANTSGCPLMDPGSPTTPPSVGHCNNDDNNNNLRGTGCHGDRTHVPSNPSIDSIDFFSAREKFLGLSEQAAQWKPESRCPAQEQHSPSPEDPAEEAPASEQQEGQGENSPPTEDTSSHPPSPNHGNGVSVRHIVTEIESISHPTVPVLTPQQLVPGDQDVETPLTTPCCPQSPSTPPSDWTAGSVRRATKQLEQKLRRELDLPLSSSSHRSLLLTQSTDSPSTDCPPLVSPSTDCPPLVSPSTDCPPLVSPSTDCPPLVSPSTDCPPLVSPSTDCPPLVSPSTDCPPLVSDMDIGPDPVFPNAHQGPRSVPSIACTSVSLAPPYAPPSPAWLLLEGVTALDSVTDGPSPSLLHHGRLALAHSSEELTKTQVTLKDLHTFLDEARVLGQTGSLRGRCHMEKPRWQRAMEVEARIRQAGLTPPSLMKRSASLAKLDCLELSATDLSDWDLRPPTKNNHRPQGPPMVPVPHSPSQEDVSKKQRVLSVSPPLFPSLLDPDRTDGDYRNPEREPAPAPACLFQGEESEEGLETNRSPQLTCTQSPKSAVATADNAWQQQQQLVMKSHSQRRLRKATDKKQTPALFYNTM